MKRLRLPERTSSRRLLPAAVLLVVTALAPSAAPAAQMTPPVRGTVALQGTMKKLYQAANAVVVTTVDGVEHVYHFTKDLVVHGGKGSDPLGGLREGSTVVVHYTVNGADATAFEIDSVGEDGLQATEGTVTRIDRGRRQVTVRYDNGRTETFRLTPRAAAEQTPGGSPTANTRVVVYYSTQSGEKVAHYFERVEKPR